VAATILIFALFGGLMWAAGKDDDEPRLSREEIRIESETNVVTTDPEPYSVEAYTVEVRDLGSEADSLLAQATVANRAEIEAYRDRVNVLERRLQNSRNDASEQQEIQAEIARLRSDYQGLQQSAQTAVSEAQEARGDATVARAEATDAKAQADTVAFASSAEDRLEKIEENLEAVNTGDENSELAVQVAALSTEIEQMLKQIGEIESDDVLSEPEMRSIETALVDLEQRVQNLNTTVSTLEQ
jgi:chromosome segregation ATPase